MAFTLALILRHLDSNLETILECNVSDYVISGILSQKHLHHDPASGKTQFILHPVAYMSEKMITAECNYGIGDKELLAIVQMEVGTDTGVVRLKVWIRI